MMFFLSAVLSLSPFAAGTLVLHPLAGIQEPDLRRISGDQEKLADQLRRLDALFARLQTRFQEEGNTDQADLLKKARKRLSNQDGLDLAVLIESIARDLAEHRTGPALVDTVPFRVSSWLTWTSDFGSRFPASSSWHHFPSSHHEYMGHSGCTQPQNAVVART